MHLGCVLAMTCTHHKINSAASYQGTLEACIEDTQIEPQTIAP